MSSAFSVFLFHPVGEGKLVASYKKYKPCIKYSSFNREGFPGDTSLVVRNPLALTGDARDTGWENPLE